MRLLGLGVPVNFNPRFPRGKRLSHLWSRLLSRYFNPRFPRGKRPTRSMNALATSIFQSTLPAREATAVWVAFIVTDRISIHASREGSDLRDYAFRVLKGISIHASREGSDIGKDTKSIDGFNFNPRFPRGKRHKLHRKLHPKTEFQSTLPAREATKAGRRFISPRNISIHASREGSDPATTIKSACAGQFQSTLPAREATTLLQAVGTDKKFQSTLPAREATQVFHYYKRFFKDFNPRFPRGKRQSGIL